MQALRQRLGDLGGAAPAGVHTRPASGSAFRPAASRGNAEVICLTGHAGRQQCMRSSLLYHKQWLEPWGSPAFARNRVCAVLQGSSCCCQRAQALLARLAAGDSSTPPAGAAAAAMPQHDVSAVQREGSGGGPSPVARFGSGSFQPHAAASGFQLPAVSAFQSPPASASQMPQVCDAALAACRDLHHHHC